MDKRLPNGSAALLFSALCALAFIGLSHPGTAYFYVFNYSCADNACIEGQTMNWTALLSNDGKQAIEYTKIELIDSFNGSTFATHERTFNPQSSDRGNPIIALPGHVTVVEFQSQVPAQKRYDALYFYPCFTSVVSDEYTLAKFGEYTVRHCYTDNLTMQSTQCIADGHCAINQRCGGNMCRTLRCGSCQYIANHSCVSYPCCADDDCQFNQLCMNRTCVPISCMENQYLFNRSCIDIECQDNEALENRSCMPLNCRADEGYANHTCVPLSCADDEVIEDHACIPLLCNPTEFIQNRSCMPLNCRVDEGYINHTCVPLSCRLYESTGNHACYFDSVLASKLAAEVFALLLIVLFLILDFVKYRHRHQDAARSQPQKAKGKKEIKGLGEELKTLPSKQGK